MADRKKSAQVLLKSLRSMQRKHQGLLAKVEETTARLGRRKAQFQAVEARIADLERRVSGPRQEHLGQLASSDGSLTHAQLIFNPSSGRDDQDNAARLAQIVSSLRAHGIKADVGLKTSGKAARKLARKAVRAGRPLVVVAGGDGTIGDIAAELVGSSTVLAIVPVGTMNNLARSLGVPLGIDDACALIGMGTTRHIDLARMTVNGSPEAEYFMECSGIGLSAIAALAGQSYEKRRWRILPRALRKFAETKIGTIRVELDDITIDATTRMVTVSNAPLMGNNMLAAPGALMDDGLLDVQIYDGMNDAALAKHFLAATAGVQDNLKNYRTRRVRMTAAVPVFANADMIITRPGHVVEIEVVPRALSMIVGNGIALSVPVESAPPAPTFATDPPAINGAAAAKPSAEPAPSEV